MNITLDLSKIPICTKLLDSTSAYKTTPRFNQIFKSRPVLSHAIYVFKLGLKFSAQEFRPCFYADGMAIKFFKNEMF